MLSKIFLFVWTIAWLYYLVLQFTGQVHLGFSDVGSVLLVTVLGANLYIILKGVDMWLDGTWSIHPATYEASEKERLRALRSASNDYSWWEMAIKLVFIGVIIVAVLRWIAEEIEQRRHS